MQDQIIFTKSISWIVQIWFLGQNISGLKWLRKSLDMDKCFFFLYTIKWLFLALRLTHTSFIIRRSFRGHHFNKFTLWSSFGPIMVTSWNKNRFYGFLKREIQKNGPPSRWWWASIALNARLEIHFSGQRCHSDQFLKISFRKWSISSIRNETMHLNISKLLPLKFSAFKTLPIQNS